MPPISRWSKTTASTSDATVAMEMTYVPEGARAHLLEVRDHLEGVEHLADVVGALQVGRHERALGLELRHEPLRLLLLVPVVVRTEADVPSDGVNRVRVTIALLPDVQLDQGQAEAVHLADQIEQRAVRDGAVAHLDERLVARHQRLQQLILVAEDRVVRGVERLRLAHDHSLEGLAGVVELIANLREHDAVGFLHGKGPPEVRVVALLAHLVHVLGRFPLVQKPGALSKRVGAPPHGQREDEVLDRLEVEVHGGDARQVHDVAGAGGGDEGISVAIAAHPAAESHDGVLHGDPRQALVDERGVDAPAEFRQTLEHRLVEVGQPRAHLVLGFRGRPANLVGSPGGLDRRRHRVEELRALVPGEARALEVEELLANGTEVLEHGPAERLGGVRGEHEVHLLLGDGLVDCLLRDPLGDEALDGAVGGLGGAAGDVVEPRVPLFHRARHVLAHVVQVEHVRKRGRQHHRLLVRQRSELGGERVEVGLRLRLVELLGQIVHILQRLEELRAGGLLDDAEEQRADQIVGLLQHLVVIELGGLARPREVLRANHRVLDGLILYRLLGHGEAKVRIARGIRASGCGPLRRDLCTRWSCPRALRSTGKQRNSQGAALRG